MSNIKQGNSTNTTFLNEIKKISDLLSAAGSAINNNEMVVSVLNGLNPAFDSFYTSIKIRNPPVSLGELHNLLLSEEIVVSEKSKLFTQSEEAKAFDAFRACTRPPFFPAPQRFNQFSHNFPRNTYSYRSPIPQYQSFSYRPSYPQYSPISSSSTFPVRILNQIPMVLVLQLQK